MTASFKGKDPIKPIQETQFMGRLVVDLIDMQRYEFNGCRWIIHAKDHFTKFSLLGALERKQAVMVASQVGGLAVICQLWPCSCWCHWR